MLNLDDGTVAKLPRNSDCKANSWSPRTFIDPQWTDDSGYYDNRCKSAIHSYEIKVNEEEEEELRERNESEK